MKYQDPKFSSRPATDAYRDGWERTFGRVTCPTCGGFYRALSAIDNCTD